MKAVAHLEIGYVSFIQNIKGGIIVNGSFKGLEANRRYALHIHEFGHPDPNRCGAHYNPQNNPHGGRYDSISHAGDLGNVKTNKMGEAKFRFIVPAFKLKTLEELFGRSVILHEGVDSLSHLHPSGNAGKRLYSAIIGRLPYTTS